MVKSIKDNVSNLPSHKKTQYIRTLEAIIFASKEPISEKELINLIKEGFGEILEINIKEILAELEHLYSSRGINITKVNNKWFFKTAPDLTNLLKKDKNICKQLSKASIETLAIIAYNQPITRGEIEEIRGISTYKGVIDSLIAANLIKLCGKRKTPGRPVTYGTTEEFLIHFSIENIKDLPGFDELKNAGFCDDINYTITNNNENG